MSSQNSFQQPMRHYMTPKEKASDLNLTIGIAQIAPVWLHREKTITKIIDFVRQAAAKNCDLVVFGEALLPGYPFWVELTDGARFNSPLQKDLYAFYLDQAVQIEAGHLSRLQTVAAELQIALMIGCIERPVDRGGHSVYCSRVYIDPSGNIGSVHRKLMPTYEERLVWAPGDGHGLRVHNLGAFTIGGLNCYENWMPLSRAALYAQGEDLHVALWPGGLHNTEGTTRFIAQEGRSYVIAVSGLMRKGDFPLDTPHLDVILQNAPDYLANGASCVASPSGKWIIEPIVGKEALAVTTIDHREVRRERQNFDLAGHYSRPEVTQLVVDRRRQSLAVFTDSNEAIDTCVLPRIGGRPSQTIL